MFARLDRNEQGAVMVEFSLVVSMLLLVTFGVIEFGYLWWQMNSAEKATQMGVRKAVVSNPVAKEISTQDCGNNNTPVGTLCNPTGTAFNTAVCTGDTKGGGTCTNGYTFDPTSFGAIVAWMQAAFPLIKPQNVQVTYSYVGLGFAGRPTPVPAVTVGLTGMTFDFFALQGFGWSGPLTMPSFEATLTGEDIDTCAPGVTAC